MGKMIAGKKEYNALIESIGGLLEQARNKAFQAVDDILVKTYWEIGRRIVVYEQQNKAKADYGVELLNMIAADLKKEYGKGFSRSNVFNFRRFYLAFKKIQTVCHPRFRTVPISPATIVPPPNPA